MPSKKRKKPQLNTHYGDTVLKEEQQVRRDFFNDDDIEDELSEEKEENGVYRSEEKVRAKARDIKKTLNERRRVEKSLPEKNDERDVILKTKTGRRKSAFVLGIIIMAFALIGFVNVIYWIGSGVAALINNDSRLRRYDDIIAPVVYFDPQPFETWQGADGHTLMYISVWETVSNSSTDDYEMNDSGRTVIPTEDVDKTARKIFGSDVVLDYEFFDDAESEIYYNGETDSVEVFNTGVDGFEHEVLSVDKSKGIITAVVGYIESDLYGENSSNENSVSYSKKMEYILRKDEKTDEYFVSAVREYTEEKK